jgi:hypothetical protein
MISELATAIAIDWFRAETQARLFAPPDRCIDFLDQLPLCRTRPRPLSGLNKTVNTKLGSTKRLDSGSTHC